MNCNARLCALPLWLRPAGLLPPARLCDWWAAIGTALVRPADFAVAVNAAKPGEHIITGVCATLPCGTMGLVVPASISASILLQPGTSTTLDTMEIDAPPPLMLVARFACSLCFLSDWASAPSRCCGSPRRWLPP